MSDWALHEAQCETILLNLEDGSVDHVIADPPYSKAVHDSVRSAKRNDARDVRDFECRTRRTVDLGFAHLTPKLRNFCAREFARLAKRWVAVFSDVESCHLWRQSLEKAGLEYVRTCQWVREGGAPQFSGDRPSSGFETITLAHRPGRKRWNGGGKAGTYVHPIVANRKGQQGSRVHTTQKPLGLMLDLIDDFTDLDDLVLDPFAGSGTTGCAAIQRGRRFIGIERMSEHAATARERLEAAAMGETTRSVRAKQIPMFGAKP